MPLPLTFKFLFQRKNLAPLPTCFVMHRPDGQFGTMESIVISEKNNQKTLNKKQKGVLYNINSRDVYWKKKLEQFSQPLYVMGSGSIKNENVLLSHWVLNVKILMIGRLLLLSNNDEHFWNPLSLFGEDLDILFSLRYEGAICIMDFGFILVT